ncbi:unnamed protein product [Arabidopsis halleri]
MALGHAQREGKTSFLKQLRVGDGIVGMEGLSTIFDSSSMTHTCFSPILHKIGFWSVNIQYGSIKYVV